jgi:hypothetical protein
MALVARSDSYLPFVMRGGSRYRDWQGASTRHRQGRQFGIERADTEVAFDHPTRDIRCDRRAD